ncbi:MAG: PAS domain S-box protein [Bacteroidota bacterium]
MIETVKKLEKKFYQLLSTDVAMQHFLNDETFAGIWFWDLHHRNNIWLSNSLKKLLGFEKDFRLQVPFSWNELLPIDNIDTIVSSFDAFLDKDQVAVTELDIPFKQKNNRINFLKCKAIAVHNKSYLFGIVNIENCNDGNRNINITEFPFISPRSKMVSEIPLQGILPVQPEDDYLASKYESVIRAGNLGGWEYKVDTGELWCSKEYFDILGYDTGSLKRWEKYELQKVWVDLLHPDDLENATAYFAQYLTHLKGGYRSEFRMKHADGNWMWISSRGSLIFEEIDGVKTLMIIGTHLDISETKRIEMELFRSNEKTLKDNALFKSIIDSPSDVFIVSIDNNYCITQFSQSYKIYVKKTFGKEIQIGYKILDLFSEAQLAIFKPGIDAALRGEHYEINTKIPSSKSESTYVFNRYNPIQSVFGEVIGATVFIQDITKEKNTEIANKVNELKYSSLFSSAGDAIFIANSKTGFIADVNLKAEELMGYTKSELVTMHQTQIHPPELLEEIGIKFKEFTSTDNFNSVETFILTKDGKRIPVEITAGSMFHVGDDIFSAAYFRDISRRRKISKELEKQNQQLREIAWTQSHMVRAPLTRIMGLANALQEGIVPECDRQQYLDYIKNSSDELDDVIKNITAKTVTAKL